MAADGEMAIDPIRPQITDQLPEAVNIELEDKGKADDDRFLPPDDGEDSLRLLLEIDDRDVASFTPQRGREIAEAEIFLFLEPDQDDAAGVLGPTGIADAVT